MNLRTLRITFEPRTSQRLIPVNNSSTPQEEFKTPLKVEYVVEEIDDDPVVDSKDNPMCLDDGEGLDRPDDVEAVIETWSYRDKHDHESLDTLGRNHDSPELEFEPDFSTPTVDRSKSRFTSSRKSAYVRSSVYNKFKENTVVNPFTQFRDIDDYRFQLRGDTQVLFSSLDIDSKHLDLAHGPRRTVEIIEKPADYSKICAKTLSAGLKFMSQKYKSQKESRKQQQILSISQNENRNSDEQNNRIANRRDTYDGVNVKNYLRGWFRADHVFIGVSMSAITRKKVPNKNVFRR